MFVTTLLYIVMKILMIFLGCLKQCSMYFRHISWSVSGNNYNIDHHNSHRSPCTSHGCEESADDCQKDSV